VVVTPVEPMSSESSDRLVLSAGDSETDSVSMPDVVPKPTWKLTEVDEPSSSLMPLNSVEAADAVDFVDQALELFVQRVLVLAADRAVAGLDRQFAQAHQDRADFVQGAFGGLHQRDAVIGVALGLIQRADLRTQALGDGEAGGVVGGEEMRRPVDRRR
jgi:hypothetical protein